MKGSAICWLEILVAIFVISLMYLLFTQVIYVYIKPSVMTGINTSGANITNALQTFAIIDMVWQYFPLILIFGMLIVGVVYSMRREPDEVYR
jgi:hypothetical protein